jgi:uncharacterized protein
MFVGVLRLTFAVVGAQSLKDKRRVVLSFKDRVVARFRVSVAEVGSLDDPRHAVLGVAVISNEAAHCDSVLAEVAHVASMLPNAVLADRATEIVSFGGAGQSIRGSFWDLPSGEEEHSR